MPCWSLAGWSRLQDLQLASTLHSAQIDFAGSPTRRRSEPPVERMVDTRHAPSSRAADQPSDSSTCGVDVNRRDQLGRVTEHPMAAGLGDDVARRGV